MKHIARFLLILVVVTVPVLSVFAQGTTQPLCNGLSDADCKILTDAQAAMASAQSFTIPAWSIAFNMVSGTDTIDLSANGTGAIALPADPTDPAAGLVLDLVMEQVTMTDTSGTQTLSMEFMIVDKKEYVNANGVWFGGDIPQSDLDTVTSLVSSLRPESGAAPAVDLGTSVTTTRGADADGAAVFTSQLDVVGLLTAVLSSPLLGEALNAASSQGGAVGTDLSGITPEQLQMMGALFGPMLTGTTISFETKVGLDDGFVHSFALDANLVMDMTMFSPDAGKITGEAHFAVELADFNAPVEVTPPANFKPLSELDTSSLPGLSSLTGSGM
jgi:hypothetical protein